MSDSNGVLGSGGSVELPATILQVISQAATANAEIAQRLIGYLEGGGHDVTRPWNLVITQAVMLEKTAQVPS